MIEPQDLPEYHDLVASPYLVKLLIDPDSGRLLAASQAAVDFYGWSEAELRQLSAWDVTPSRNRADTLAMLAEIAAGRDLSPRPNSRHLRRDGELRDVMVYPDPVKHAGRVLILAIVVDVTERRRAEADLRKSEERFRQAMEAAEEGLWEWDLVTNQVYYSPGFYAMLGYPPEAMAPHLESAAQLLHPDDRDAAIEGARRLLRDPGHYIIEFRMRAANGDYRWLESHGKVVERDADGNPRRAVGTHIDITERRRLEQALRRGEAQLRSIIEGATDAIYVKDLEGRYVRLNRAAVDFFAREPEDLLGQDDNALLGPEAARILRDLDRQVLAEDKTLTFEERITGPDGIPRTFFTTKGPLRDEAGQVFGLFGISKDITELLRKEQRQRETLEENRHLLELALAGADLGTWDVELPSGQCRYDARYCALLGYPPGELEPTMEASQRLIHPDDLAAVNQAIRAHLNGETRRYEAEHRMRHKEGHWVWILARGKATYDEEGRPTRATGTVLDITDRKRVATEGVGLLRRIENLLASLDPRTGAEGSPFSEDRGQGRGKARLTDRHREVLGLLAKGATVAQIAERLGISKETVMTHRRNLMRKLGLHNKAELIRYAILHNIEVPDYP